MNGPGVEFHNAIDILSSLFAHTKTYKPVNIHRPSWTFSFICIQVIQLTGEN